MTETTRERRITTRRTAGLAGLGAGVLWLAAWVHLLFAHGTTTVNEGKLVLGLTWLDSGRLLTPALLLAAAAVWLISSETDGRALHVTALATVLGMAVAMVGTMLAFWTQPFGTYDGVVRDQGPAAIGGVLSVGGSAIMTVGLVGFAASAARARVLHWLSAVGLVIGAFLAFPWLYESVQGGGLGVALVVISVLMLLGRG